jgi:hypothetical protein
VAKRDTGSATADKLPPGFRLVGDEGQSSGDDNDDLGTPGSERSNDGGGDVISSNGSGGVVDPASLGGNPSGDASGNGGRKRRGRKPGSGNRAGKTSASETTNSIADVLSGLHAGMAYFLNIPELNLDDSESKKLSKAVTRVTELYEIPLPDEKIQAWVMLAVTCSGIYGPRLATVMLKQKMKPTKAKVVDMPFVGSVAN